MKLPKHLPVTRAAAPTAIVIGTAAAALAALAVANALIAKLSERRHPPRGRILEVDGVPVHYFEAGAGKPVVLIHGNGVTAEDFVVSGLFRRLAANNRVIAFDRAGFGYSARPRSKIWTAKAQATLIGAALDQLGVSKATVVAHSWGTLVALRLALHRPDLVAGLGLLSGYYWPTPRLDAEIMSGPAIPVIGDIMRFTLSPLIGWLVAPLAFRLVFSPAKIPETFKANFPKSMSLRPSQIRAASGDTALMPFEAFKLSKRYGEIAVPTLLIAGDGDKIVSYTHQSVKLANKLGCELRTVVGAGHMVHHIAPNEVGAAIEGLIARAEGAGSARGEGASSMKPSAIGSGAPALGEARVN
jgi:pimeloyl-ACP methyl ester carboxylesterase